MPDHDHSGCNTDPDLLRSARLEPGNYRNQLKPSPYRSLGVVLSGGGAAYRDALEAVIAADNGIHAYHHDVVARLARTVGVTAIVDRHGGWQEIDRPEDIERWTHSPRPESL